MSTSNLHRGVLLFACALILSVLNFMIFAKERIISEGTSVYLALAPVDPRAILQGDFMTLRFELADQLERSAAASKDALDRQAQVSNPQFPDGKFRWAQVALDAKSVATLHESSTRHALRIR